MTKKLILILPTAVGDGQCYHPLLADTVTKSWQGGRLGLQRFRLGGLPSGSGDFEGLLWSDETDLSCEALGVRKQSWPGWKGLCLEVWSGILVLTWLRSGGELRSGP